MNDVFWRAKWKFTRQIYYALLIWTTFHIYIVCSHFHFFVVIGFVLLTNTFIHSEFLFDFTNRIITYLMAKQTYELLFNPFHFIHYVATCTLSCKCFQRHFKCYQEQSGFFASLIVQKSKWKTKPYSLIDKIRLFSFSSTHTIWILINSTSSFGILFLLYLNIDYRWNLVLFPCCLVYVINFI